MSIVERIEESFENGEDFNFMASDVQELKALVTRVERYEKALKEIVNHSTFSYQGEIAEKSLLD